MSNFVFVIDTKKQPLNPVHPGQARLLLKQRKASVFRRYPFTIILKDVHPKYLTHIHRNDGYHYAF
ncbi:MAG: RRXRR domain-containing protein [Xenococcaceae cyanobacterium MO_167.B27]|nr:RRXRR domain-containing protein [Xenococcaceae cyanobacterium MO_167.B27]